MHSSPPPSAMPCANRPMTPSSWLRQSAGVAGTRNTKPTFSASVAAACSSVSDACSGGSFRLKLKGKKTGFGPPVLACCAASMPGSTCIKMAVLPLLMGPTSVTNLGRSVIGRLIVKLSSFWCARSSMKKGPIGIFASNIATPLGSVVSLNTTGAGSGGNSAGLAIAAKWREGQEAGQVGSWGKNKIIISRRSSYLQAAQGSPRRRRC